MDLAPRRLLVDMSMSFTLVKGTNLDHPDEELILVEIRVNYIGMVSDHLHRIIVMTMRFHQRQSSLLRVHQELKLVRRECFKTPIRHLRMVMPILPDRLG